VSSVRDRQRAAARARLEREMAARAEAVHRRRRQQLTIGAAAGGVVLILLAVWIFVGGGDGKDSATPAPGPTSATCNWTPLVNPSMTPRPTLPPAIHEVGTPPTVVPSTGFQIMTITTNIGEVKVQMDLAKTPCTAASFTYLASKGFYKDSPCHRLVPSILALQCGDPSGTGQGGPTYRFANENLPTTRKPTYVAGDVAMANADQEGQESQGTNGSQFFFVYGDSALPANYSVWGKVIAGFDVIQKVSQGGFEGAADAGEGKPKVKLTILSITVSAPTTQTPKAEPLPSSVPSPTPSATPSATPSPAPSAS
jgi:peptidyl-prolyl cis-trans isomerase B (cyclophilin B)